MRPTGLRSLYHRDLHALWNEIEAFDEAALWHAPKGIANSAGNLCLHICGNLRHYIGSLMGGDDYKRDRAKEFSAKGLAKEELLVQIDETVIAVDRVLGELQDDACNAPFPGELPVPAEDTCQFLLHLYGHLNYHLGQINYLRRMTR